MKKNMQVIVVGGGAAGMMAAISAKRLGADVTILEKNPRVGKKMVGAISLISMLILVVIIAVIILSLLMAH
jgi:flavin-dependent dehydrogenase